MKRAGCSWSGVLLLGWSTLSCTDGGDDSGDTVATSGASSSSSGTDAGPGDSADDPGDDDGTVTDDDAVTDTDPTDTADDDTGTTTMGTDDGSDSDSDTGMPGACGNAMLDPGEMCDEADGEDADGCNEDCTVSGAILFEHTQSAGLGLAEDFFSVTVDPEGNAYAAGQTNPTVDGTDFWVRQYTADGGLGWEYTVGGSANTSDTARDIVYFDDAVYTVGNTNEAGTSNNWYVRETTTGGSGGYTVAYDSAINGSDVAETVAVDGAGNIYVGGRQAIDLEGQDMLVRQYAPGGSVGWTATYTGPAASDDRINGIAVDGAGNVIIGGWHTVPGQGRDAFVRKLDPAGNTIWTQTYAGAAALDDEIRSVAVDGLGNVVVAGVEGMALPATVVWIRRYDPDGTELWTQTWSGATSEGAEANDVAIDSAGHIVVVGTELEAGSSDGMVRKYDDTGTLRWSQLYETTTVANQFIRGCAIGEDDRIWIAGGLNVGLDNRDAWIAMLAP